MELVIKASAVALCSMLICLLIKKSNPEMSMLLGAAVTVAIAVAAIAMLDPIAEFCETIKKTVKISDLYIVPVLKCTGIGITVKLAADLCRENSQTAMAAAIELAGTVCALAAAMPLINSLIMTVCGLI